MDIYCVYLSVTAICTCNLLTKEAARDKHTCFTAENRLAPWLLKMASTDPVQVTRCTGFNPT